MQELTAPKLQNSKMDIEATNFIEEIIVKDLESGKHKSVLTRFPPEPNGYLHIGHSKSLSINFGIKEKFSGKCNLRFDDTNPAKEEQEYIDAIKRDIKWLGYEWDIELYASDYFQKMYDYAVLLIEKGLAFVCDLNAEQIRDTRGTLTEHGKESPFRNRTVKENLKLFQDMKNGVFADGEKVLRAKIDMKSPNMNMRDPVIYRILRAHHPRTKNDWLIYPMYDYAHPLSDAIEAITHSICTLEFEDHRPLYDWVTENCGFKNPPRQYEFARLNIKNTIMSKRYLKKLVDSGVVFGWHDPRMPTLSGLRERGFPPEAIKEFCKRVGVAKANSEVDSGLLEYCVRENLNRNADRAMAIETPLKVIIDNIKEGEEFAFSVLNNPNNEDSGTHSVVLCKEIYIDSADFEVNPPPKYHRLTEGGMVRLKGSFILKHISTELSNDKKPIAIHCEYIEDSAQGGKNADIKVKGVIQWVSAKYAKDATLYKLGYLLNDAKFIGEDFAERFNENSLTVVKGAKIEPFIANQPENTAMQFMRMAYYKKAKDGVYYEIVALKDSFNKNA